ncbi:hypothetical protein BN946_scf185033.g11 [Trametes cinnabarina]|uniref:Uncharacterized protein n=1 Tax=Pycnoporus cinnabarinus TaxID=5643 RepID=A0A060SX90_PYCCI|nr:hypothetical protein BN946_scf185033.g11 [Trametes cinnabarina]
MSSTASPAPAPSSKRPLPTEPVLTASGRRKPKTKHEESPFTHFGRHYVRAIEMFTLPSTVVTAGLLRDPDANEQRYSAIENRHYRSFQALVKLVPTFAMIIENEDAPPEEVQKLLDDFAGCLSLGASGAKSDDTSSLRGAVIDWLQKDFRKHANVDDLDRDMKTGRGFRNPITGHLLCPAVLNWDSESVRAELLDRTATINGDLINGSHWPNFLYAGTFNPDLPWVGFLQGKYLLRTYCHIFTSPSSAKGDMVAPGSARATRCGNAAIFGMTNVTEASIAYAAAQASSCPICPYSFKTQKACDALGLYNAIRDYLEAPEFAMEREALLLWWNRQFFPTHHVQRSTINHGLEQMRAARCKQAALAAAESAETSASGSGAEE